jgi:uncharacterized protein
VDPPANAVLAAIDPQLQPGTYVFCALGSEPPPPGLDALLRFAEPEGTTVVATEREAAEHGLVGAFSCEWVVLGGQTELEGVGLLAAVTGCLAEAGIASNVVSAVHHDHLFVPEGSGRLAVEVLRERQRRAVSGPPR